MMYKATLTFSLLFLAIVGSAQSDGGNIPAQPQSSPLPATQTVAPQVHPSGSPISMPPPSSDGVYNSTQPNGFQPDSGIPTGQQPPLNGVVPSAAPGASDVPKPNFTTIDSDHQPHFKPTNPNVTFSDGAFPTANATLGLKPNQTDGSQSQGGNFTLATPSSKAGPVQQDLPSSTASYVGRRRLVQRRV